MLTITTTLLSGCLSGGLLDTGYELVCDTTLPEVDVSWGVAAVTLTISERDDMVRFGLAETGSTCTGADCWTGEDCIFGFSLEEPMVLYCHPIEPGGVTLAYTPDSREDLEPGEQTAFRQQSPSGALYDGQVTFYLEDEDGCCYSFGHNPDYYDALGCAAL